MEAGQGAKRIVLLVIVRLVNEIVFICNMVESLRGKNDCFALSRCSAAVHINGVISSGILVNLRIRIIVADCVLEADYRVKLRNVSVLLFVVKRIPEGNSVAVIGKRADNGGKSCHYTGKRSAHYIKNNKHF